MNLSDGSVGNQGDSSTVPRSNPAGEHPRKWLVIALIAAAVPLIFLIYLLHRYADDVPTWDDWEMAPIIARAVQKCLESNHALAARFQLEGKGA